LTQLQALVFARCVGFVLRAPGFSHPSVPPPLRAGFAYALALAIAAGRKGAGDMALSALVVALFGEVVLGAAIGIAASMLYDGAYSGGRALDDYVGIRASVPTAGLVAGAGFGRLWSLAFAAAFFGMGGHRVALDAFARAFDALPPGVVVRADDTVRFAVALPATLLRAALLVAGPAIVIALVVQIALGVVARVVPRFSTFTLAFPLVLGCALLATIAALPLVLPEAARPWLDLSALRTR
jgi:flagellar biosynthetic protein FliR